MERGAILQPAAILSAAVAGLAFGAFATSDTAWLIEPLLMAMLFFVFLAVDASGIRRAFSDTGFTSTALLVNFVWTPVFAMLLGSLFFNESTEARFGLLMLLVTPCTDWFLVFTGIAKGNTALSSAILPLNLIIQVILLPIYAEVFFGASLSFDIVSMLGSTVFVLVIPLALAILMRMLSARLAHVGSAVSFMKEKCDPLQTFFLCLAVAAMTASASSDVTGNVTLLVYLIIPLMVFFVVNYVLCVGIGRAEKRNFDDTTSLLFTSMARNSPLALAICAAAFPEETIVLLILAVGPLIELPVLAVAAEARLRMRRDPGT